MSMKTLDHICIAAIVLCATVCLVFAGPRNSANPDTQEMQYGYEEIDARVLDAFTHMEIYDCDDLTGDILTSRTGMIIERCIGIVETENGDGRVLNCSDPEFSYIAYGDNIGFSVGDTILTYLIYDPLGCGEDDIIDRYDFNLSAGGNCSGK